MGSSKCRFAPRGLDREHRRVDFNVTFTTYLDGVPDAEAGLAGVLPGNRHVFGSITDFDDGIETGFALANPLDEQVNVSVAYQESGNEESLTTDVVLPPLGQTALFFSRCSLKLRDLSRRARFALSATMILVWSSSEQKAGNSSLAWRVRFGVESDRSVKHS